MKVQSTDTEISKVSDINLFYWNPLGGTRRGPLLESFSAIASLDPPVELDSEQLQAVNRFVSFDLDWQDDPESKGSSLVVPLLSVNWLRYSEIIKLFTSSVVKAVNCNRLRIFFDHSNEGFFPADVSRIVDLCEELGVERLCNIILVCQNRHPVVCERAVSHFRYDFFFVRTWMALQEILANHNQLPLSAIGANDNLSARSEVLCLNATPRLNRVVSLLALFKEQVIATENYKSTRLPQLPWISFPGLHYSKGFVSGQSVRQHLQSPELTALSPYLDTLLAMAPLQTDRTSLEGNALWNVVDVNSYKSTVLSCVTETTTCPGLERITEKTLKPLLLGHPVVVFGPRHAVRIARELGFRLFDHVINHAYDTVDSENQRILKAAGAARDFMASIRAGQISALDLCEDSAFNVEWGRRQFLDRYLRENAVPLLTSITWHS